MRGVGSEAQAKFMMLTMQPEELVLPVSEPSGDLPSKIEADPGVSSRISAWLEASSVFISRFWAKHSAVIPALPVADPEACVDQLIAILLHKKFNHQSRGQIAHTLPRLRRTLGEKISCGRPITLFLLYHGGYRASPIPKTYGLIFCPDQTELMLLFQITLLKERMEAIYKGGVEFVLVLNNGVARWVNDIPCAATEAYAERLRDMIRSVGAEKHIRILVQSQLPGFSEQSPAAPPATLLAFDVREHRLVERFLGRQCSEEEARYRSALYQTAETIWAEELRPIEVAEGAIVLRQVAHAATLSFRPFPGGAIRVQNGTLGFVDHHGRIIPRLITTSSFERSKIRVAPIILPKALRGTFHTAEAGA